MFGILKNKKVEMLPPMVGEVITIEKVPDPAFSQKMVGEGFAIKPSVGKVYAPFDAEVIQIFPTKHAIGLRSEKGLGVLIHVGINTVELKGEGFTSFVQAGDQVKKGQKLLQVELESIEAAGKSIVTPIVFTNKNQYKSFDVSYQSVEKNDICCTIKLKK